MTHTDQPPRGTPAAPPQSAKERRKARRDAAGVSPVLAQQIDENLKRLYRQQVEQELPAELQALVARLRAPGGEGRQ